MLHVAIARRMEKNDDHHNFCLRHRGITMIFSLFCWFYRIFAIMASKNLQKSSAIQ